MDRDKYLVLIARLSHGLHRSFGNVWWYSLLHEKNTTISDSYHNMIKGPITKERFLLVRSLIGAVKKYCAFVVRKFLFRRRGQRKQIKALFDTTETLILTYSKGHLKELEDNIGFSTSIILPQRTDWKQLSQDVKTKTNTLVIDTFLPYKEFFFIPFRYCGCLLNFFMYKWELKNQIGYEYIYASHEKDIWRSFAGDVLVDGLFYEAIMKNIAKKFSKIERVIYVYEGRAWEKALCLAFPNTKKIGILCSAPAMNILNFFYNKEEIDIMPSPDHLGLTGKTPYNLMRKDYGKKAFVFGTARYSHIEGWLGKTSHYDRQYVLVALGWNNNQAKEVLKFMDKALSKSEFVVRRHPDSNINLDYYQEGDADLEYVLRRAKAVVCSDSCVSIESLALGTPVIVPNLPSYVDMNPLSGITPLGLWAETPDDIERLLDNEVPRVRRVDCRSFVKDYFTFNTPEKMVEIIRGL